MYITGFYAFSSKPRISHIITAMFWKLLHACPVGQIKNNFWIICVPIRTVGSAAGVMVFDRIDEAAVHHLPTWTNGRSNLKYQPAYLHPFHRLFFLRVFLIIILRAQCAQKRPTFVGQVVAAKGVDTFFTRRVNQNYLSISLKFFSKSHNSTKSL